MATLDRKRNSYRVRVSLSEDRRVPITIGAVSKQVAEASRRFISDLEASRAAGVEPRAETRAWLADLEDDLHQRIAKTGLVAPRRPKTPTQTIKTIGDAIDQFFATSNTVPVTALAYKQGTDCLADHFSRVRPVAGIDTADVDQFVANLRKSKLAGPTMSKRLQVIKRIFSRCVRWGWIQRNPFEHVRPGKQTNPERLRYITAADVRKLIDAAPDAEWRAIIALARFGGLRCPSEVLSLRWDQVDFQQSRVRVPSPKTAKAGKPFRIIPLFAELRPYLEDLRQVKDAESEFVISRYRVSTTNLRTYLDRIIGRAKVPTFPKPFQNMRASRATDIQKAFGPKAATDWLGHTEGVALLHYWQTTEADFLQAATTGTSSPKEGGQKGGQTPTDIKRQEVSPEGDTLDYQLKNAVFEELDGIPEKNQWALQDSNL